MAAFPTNDQYLTITTKRTIPDAETALTGQWTATAASKTLVGTASLALTEIGGDAGIGNPTTLTQIGAWLLDKTNNELRRISDVVSNTIVVLESGFTNAQVATTLYYVPQSKAAQIGIACAAGGGLVNNEALPVNGFVNYGSDQGTDYFINPLLVDGSSGTLKVSILYNGSGV